ncbi:uncharacterized protein LOC112456453 [Temnothorax curvispinosus]|uniref:Uncharacterized protein LOC112456453 n=1 Tax=Temnothorax curvispinosus TaxID=300111 RepID=A0A6J1PZT9_9HYME|nr:uncharacterized protein LOC112456453 [Temnothorax curvispinosus]
MVYGVEVWGWLEHGNVEGEKARYLRWSLGLERCTPGYVAFEETKRDKIRIRTKLAVNFEEKERQGYGRRRWVMECIKEREGRGTLTRGRSEREEYLSRCGVQEADLEQWRERGRCVAEELSSKDRRRQRKEQEILIEWARYNKRYRRIKVAGLPEYLRRKGESGSHKRKARARCGNEKLKNKYWLREEERNCNVCGREESTLEHLMERCVWKSTSRVVLDDIIGEKETEGSYRWLKEREDKKKEESRNRRVAQSQVGQGVRL